MAGIPPLAGFFGKFFLFFSAFKAGNYSLVVLGLVVNVISAFYYLRIIKCLFFEERGDEYSFFVGEKPQVSAMFDVIFATLLSWLLISPFFLSDLLYAFCYLAVSAIFIDVRFYDFMFLFQN
jgi:NADH-quinone oxidoreductase subunit N